MDIAHIIGKMKRVILYIRKIHREIDEIKHLGESIPIEQRKTVLFVSSMDGYTGTGSLFDDMCKYVCSIMHRIGLAYLHGRPLGRNG